MTRKPIGQVEFVAMLGMQFGMIAFSIDSMPPALPAISDDLAIPDPEHVLLVLSYFIVGMGAGTFFVGPLSDAFGRRRVILIGTTLYVAMAVLAANAPSFELLILARFFQGMGVSAPRVVSLAVVRDLFVGREMARILSIAFLVFSLIPALAPALGALIQHLVGWRGIFFAMAIFGIIAANWVFFRLEETLPQASRTRFSLRQTYRNARDVMAYREVQVSVTVQSLGFAMLFSVLNIVQLLFDQTFGLAASFPAWFASIAVLGGICILSNAALVRRLGMRRLVQIIWALQVPISLVCILAYAAAFPAPWLFWVSYAWIASVFLQTGMTVGNVNAIGLEPVGHLAGTAASVIGAISTVFGAALAIPIGLLFDGTPVFVAAAIGICAGLAWAITTVFLPEERQDVAKAG